MHIYGSYKEDNAFYSRPPSASAEEPSTTMTTAWIRLVLMYFLKWINLTRQLIEKCSLRYAVDALFCFVVPNSFRKFTWFLKFDYSHFGIRIKKSVYGPPEQTGHDLRTYQYLCLVQVYYTLSCKYGKSKWLLLTVFLHWRNQQPLLGTCPANIAHWRISTSFETETCAVSYLLPLISSSPAELISHHKGGIRCACFRWPYHTACHLLHGIGFL